MKLLRLIIIPLLVVTGFNLVQSPPAKAYSNADLIDDAIFTDPNPGMDATQIQIFLNQFPSSCISNYSDEQAIDFYNYGSTTSAANIIRRVANLWGINPRVLLTKLEQEENLVTGSAGCPLWRYVSAMGYDCPGATRDTTFRGTPVTTCVKDDSAMGFSRQVTKAGWELKFGEERANGNLTWQDPSDYINCYYGPFTQGTRQYAPITPNRDNCSITPFTSSGVWNGIFLLSGATASLYSYTPFVPSGFPGIYESFFGVGSTSAAPVGKTFVNRFFNLRDGSHFWSASPSETLTIQNTLQSTFRYEGVAWIASADPTQTPVYRFFNLRDGTHFWSANQGEVSYIRTNLQSTWRFEGIVYYASDQPTQVPLYRFFDKQNGTHFYSTNQNEVSYLRWNRQDLFNFEGIAYYVW